MAKKKKKVTTEEFSFEESFEELREIVDKLEDGNLTLGESLKSYEVGIKRLQQCYKALNDAELKIRQFVKLDADGNLVTGQFNVSESETPGRKSTSSTDEVAPEPDELF